jgi:thiamine pyrophosphokinase
MTDKTIILADGSFPQHEIPLKYLREAGRIVCCDGSVKNLISEGLEPDAIVGDMDSLPEDLSAKYAGRLFPDDEQETNDLTKAVKWCSKRGHSDIIILGATGKREDHTLGNISLLADYAKEVGVIMVSDTGIIRPLLQPGDIMSFPGQQVSIFSLDPLTEITSHGLKYKLDRLRLNSWWRASLNESTGDRFSLSFTGGPLILFLKFRD